ncbi:hypothetical protein J4440_00695 [Candidatus Woesearchaeota archaeon]|nr:hypothetical protein [Candidatus Woesearchaeota archaeon]
MIDKKDFENIRKQMEDFEAKREETIQNSRQTITLSKQIIYSIHRNDFENASKLLKEIKLKIKGLDKKKNYDTGICSVAFQEFVEAVAFFEIIKNNKLPNLKELNVEVEEYLSGLADLTGELGRKAVHDAIKKDFNSVLKIRLLVEEIYGEFLKFDLRNGELRKKSDAIKWNLNKLEDLVLSLNLTSRV